MKLIIILLTVAIMQASAAGFAQTVDLKAKAAPLADILADIQRQTGYNFVVSSDLLAEAPKINIDVRKTSISEALDKCFKNLPYQYIINEKTIVVKRKKELPPSAGPTILQQTKPIKGKVTDETGEPVIGATVTEKGTQNRTVTDLEGNFNFSVSDNATSLVVSGIGYTESEINIQGKDFVNVSMTFSIEQLSQVVVVGYGTQKRTDILGAVSSVSSKDLDKAVFNTVDQLIQGRAAGVLSTSTSGEPGADVAIRIRGNNSINGNNSPLYVVDGIPVTGVPNFNPQDIESLDILKDASATAIYGSRGANGVIMITTKRGTLGKTVIGVTTNTSVSKVLQTYEMLNGEDYARYRNEAILAKPNPGPIPFPNPEQYAGQGFNWQDEIIENGVRNDYGLNISGGKEGIKFYISGNYLDDKGIILESRFTRSNLRANVDADALNDKLKLKFSLNTSHEKSNRAISESRAFPSAAGPIVNALMSEPIVPNLRFSGFTGENEQFYNPYLEVVDKEDKGFITNFIANTSATYSILKELSLTVSGGLDYRLNERGIYYPSTVGSGINGRGVAVSNNNRGYDYVVNSYLNYNKTFNNKHDLGFTLGAEYSEYNNYGYSSNVSNFEVESLNLDNLGIGTSRNSINSSRNQSILQSGFFRANYAFDQKYLINATIRADGSSRFAANNKWGYFPSLGLGWRVSEEEFMQPLTVISNLKLRASIGETGSQAIAPYQSLSRYSTTVYPIGNAPALGYIPTSVANPNLRWETTRQFDLGLDLGLFRNRLELTLDYFDKKTIDLLSTLGLPGQTGYSNAFVNFGSIANKGVELSLGGYVLDKKTFKWNSNVNLTSYKNTVLELGGDERIFGPNIGTNLTGSSGHIYTPGGEYGLFWGLIATGLIQQSDLDAATAAGKPLPAFNNDRALGHWKYQDLNSDGVINNLDQQEIGNPNPSLIFGFNNDFTYKNFGLNVFIQGTLGNDVYNTLGTIVNEGFDNNESYKNQTVEWYNRRWTPQNPHNDIRFPSINSLNPTPANYMVEDASYVRLKNISLRYQVPLKSKVIGGLQLYVTGTNLLTITNYTGFDPEVSQLGANTLSPGVDLGAYPRQSIYTFGLNAKF